LIAEQRGVPNNMDLPHFSADHPTMANWLVGRWSARILADHPTMARLPTG